MRILLMLFLFTVAKFTLVAQVTRKKSIKNDVPEYKETFYVLEDDPNIRHGPSEKEYIGYSAYKEEGQYDYNKKSGIWKYYNIRGEIGQLFDHDNDSLFFSEPFNSVTNSWILIGDSVIENRTGTKPILLGGDGKYFYYLRYLKYPAEARASRREGAVFISARVTSDGRLIDEKIEKKLGMGLDEEAMKVIQLLPDEWIPLKVNGVPIDAKVLFRLRFLLE